MAVKRNNATYERQVIALLSSAYDDCSPSNPREKYSLQILHHPLLISSSSDNCMPKNASKIAVRNKNGFINNIVAEQGARRM